MAAGVKVFLHLSLPQLSLQRALLHDTCRTALLVGHYTCMTMSKSIYLFFQHKSHECGCAHLGIHL